MAELLNIPIPAISKSYYSGDNISGISAQLQNIKSGLGVYIRVASTLVKLPASLITSIIFIESDGQNVPENGAGAIGYMQITSATAYDTIRYFASNNLLSLGIKAILQAKIPFLNLTIRGNQFPFWDFSTLAKPQLESGLQDPELNILLGTMYLRIALDKTVSNGHARLDKAIVFYNFGMYNSLYGTASWQDSTVQSLYQNSELPEETKNYILKLMGVNGTLDILLNNKS